MTEAIEKKTRLIFNLGVVYALITNQEVCEELLKDNISADTIDKFKDALKTLVNEMY